jgi:hypothetical protein
VLPFTDIGPAAPATPNFTLTFAVSVTSTKVLGFVVVLVLAEET